MQFLSNFVKFWSFFGKKFIFKNDIAQKLYIIISKTNLFWKAKNSYDIYYYPDYILSISKIYFFWKKLKKKKFEFLKWL